MKIKSIVTRVALVLGVVGVGVPLAATVASASTPGCTNGVYSGYCATQTDSEASPLSLDVYGQHAAYNNKIIGYQNSATDPATDFFIFKYGPSTVNAKVYEYAPDGVASNLCISEPSKNDGLVLRNCNGSPWQLWTAGTGSGTAVTWVNQETGDIMTFHGLRGQVTGANAPVAPVQPTTSQELTFG